MHLRSRSMSRPDYSKEFNQAVALLRRGICPDQDVLEHIYEQHWEDHLGFSEKEKAEECLKEYGDEKWL